MTGEKLVTNLANRSVRMRKRIRRNWSRSTNRSVRIRIRRNWSRSQYRINSLNTGERARVQC